MGPATRRPTGRGRPLPPERRGFRLGLRFRNPVSLGTISEAGDDISTSNTTPLVEEEPVEPGPGDGIMGNGEEHDICGESFFEGFHNDTELSDGTHSIISLASHGQLTIVGDTDIRLTKENQISRLSYFNRSQQSSLQDFIMPTPFPAGVSERPSNTSDRNFDDKSRDDLVRRQTDSTLLEGQSLNATRWLHNSLTPFSNATANVFGEYKSEHHNTNQEEGETTTTWMTGGHGETTPGPTPKQR